MPEINGSLPVHLWRINPSASYSMFPTAAEFGIGATATKKIANTAPDGTYANAVWVDVDYACGQCHGGGTSASSPAVDSADRRVKGLPYYNKATLAAFAEGIHTPDISANTAPAAKFSSAGITATGYTASFTDASTDAQTSQGDLVVTVKWGDGGFSTGSGGGTFSHTYATAGKFNVTLSAQDAGGLTGMAIGSVSAPSRFSISGTVFMPNGSTGFDNVANVYLKQNGITKALLKTTAGVGTYTFPNLAPGTYQVQVYRTGKIFDGDPAAGVQNPITVVLGSANQTGKNFTQVP
jgi:hypothetical protein